MATLIDKKEPEAQLPEGKRFLSPDRLIGIALLVACAIFFRASFDLPAPVWDPLGMAFWPRVILGSLFTIAICLVFFGQIGSEIVEKVDPKAFLVVGFGIAYVLTLQTLGFLLTTPVFVFVSVILLGLPISRRRILEALLLAAISTGLVYVLFQQLLIVSLPEGDVFQ